MDLVATAPRARVLAWGGEQPVLWWTGIRWRIPGRGHEEQPCVLRDNPRRWVPPPEGSPAAGTPSRFCEVEGALQPSQETNMRARTTYAGRAGATHPEIPTGAPRGLEPGASIILWSKPRGTSPVPEARVPRNPPGDKFWQWHAAVQPSPEIPRYLEIPVAAAVVPVLSSVPGQALPQVNAVTSSGSPPPAPREPAGRGPGSGLMFSLSGDEQSVRPPGGLLPEHLSRAQTLLGTGDRQADLLPRIRGTAPGEECAEKVRIFFLK